MRWSCNYSAQLGIFFLVIGGEDQDTNGNMSAFAILVKLVLQDRIKVSVP